MTDYPFNATVRPHDNKIVIDMRGEINAFADNALNEAYTEAEAQNPETIVLNFEGVDYINSTGIALIVGLLAQARKSKLSLIVYGLSDHYIEIFKITRLADFMTIFETEDSALAS